MVSPTKQSERIRARKQKAMGRARKNKATNHGSTKPRAELFKVVES